MSRDRTGESWRRIDNGEDIVGFVKRSTMCTDTFYDGGCEQSPGRFPYQKWIHFVKVVLPTGEVKHRKWSEIDICPWETCFEKVVPVNEDDEG